MSNPTAETWALFHGVLQACDLTMEQAQGERGKASLSFRRQMAMYFMRRLGKLSYPAVGDFFHRDHSTVIHGDRLVAARAKKSSAFADSLVVREHAILQSVTEPEFVGCAA